MVVSILALPAALLLVAAFLVALPLEEALEALLLVAGPPVALPSLVPPEALLLVAAFLVALPLEEAL